MFWQQGVNVQLKYLHSNYIDVVVQWKDPTTPFVPIKLTCYPPNVDISRHVTCIDICTCGG